MKNKVIVFLFHIIIIVQLGGEENFPILPKPVQDYFDAIGKGNRNVLRNSYNENATIIDVNRTINGVEAIMRWSENEVFGGKYKILKVISTDQNHSELIVEFKPKGLNSGFRAIYKFKLLNDKINHMNLQYAN